MVKRKLLKTTWQILDTFSDRPRMQSGRLRLLWFCITWRGQAGETVIKPQAKRHFKIIIIPYWRHIISWALTFRLFSNLCLRYEILNGLAPFTWRDLVSFRLENSREIHMNILSNVCEIVLYALGSRLFLGTPQLGGRSYQTDIKSCSSLELWLKSNGKIYSVLLNSVTADSILWTFASLGRSFCFDLNIPVLKLFNILMVCV